MNQWKYSMCKEIILHRPQRSLLILFSRDCSWAFVSQFFMFFSNTSLLSIYSGPDSPLASKTHPEVRTYVRQLNVIDNQRTLTQLSHELEPRRSWNQSGTEVFHSDAALWKVLKVGRSFSSTGKHMEDPMMLSHNKMLFQMPLPDLFKPFNFAVICTLAGEQPLISLCCRYCTTFISNSNKGDSWRNQRFSWDLNFRR